MLSLFNRSYISMFKVKSLQPELTRIKELYKNDSLKQHKETIALFKRNNVNPMSSIFPMLIQIPVFFALYKVLFVTIEMRHAPFFYGLRIFQLLTQRTSLHYLGCLIITFLFL